LSRVRRHAPPSDAVACFLKPVEDEALLDAIDWAISKVDDRHGQRHWEPRYRDCSVQCNRCSV